LKLARCFAALACAAALLPAAAPAAPSAQDLKMPRYRHIFVIMEENKDYGQIIDSPDAPFITKMAHEFGNATAFYAETHPSEPNYVALVGGYTYGIQDDDAFYCKPHDSRKFCSGSNKPGYPDHTVNAPNLATQLQAAGLTWKNYNESLPEAGSLAVIAPDPDEKDAPNLPVYASKHSGFVNFASVQNDPKRAQHLVDFKQLDADLKSGNVPNFSLIIPNLCDEMHGAGEPDTPEDCSYANMSKLIWRGDRNVKELVQRIMASSAWREKANDAIVVTFDEDDHYGKQGCCGTDPHDPANAGGGHIATIVITNHGPHGISDSTPYSHYSLLRTIEDAFGIHTYLHQAAAAGVRPMLPLFGASTSVPRTSK
jgi:phospholipase C